MDMQGAIMSTAGRWHAVTTIDVLSDGGMVGIETAGMRIAIYYVSGNYFATDSLCSHGRAKLTEGSLYGFEVECPLHAARFDVRTGVAVCGPATRSLKTFPVRANGADIELWLDETLSK